MIVVDNAGYTIERALQSPQAVYNDVAPGTGARSPARSPPGRPAHRRARHPGRAGRRPRRGPSGRNGARCCTSGCTRSTCRPGCGLADKYQGR
ncbi:hypothetical protein HBB16_00380 [Pseudonocardia sp. MCCB 268]|nr:hypothetical protein [Pseudonocardia cytotoxica]